MKIKTKAYNNIQTVLRFLYDRVNEQHEDCAHAIKLRSSDITGMSMDSIVDAVRYLEQLEYIEFTTKSYYSEKYHEVKNQQLKLEEKMGKSIFNQNSCMSMAIRYFTDDGKLLQSLKQELEQLKHGAELEILVTPTKKFQDGCRSFGITGKGAIVYQFSYDEKTREVTINKQVFHRCSLNSTPDEFLTATMKVRKYGDPIIWNASKREPNKIFNDIKLNKILSRLFFAPLSKDGKTFTFRKYVTEYDIAHEKINTKKVNQALERLIGAN